METIKTRENNHTDNCQNLVDNILLMFVQKTLVIGWGYCTKVKELSGRKEPTELDEAAIAFLKRNEAVNRGFAWSSLGVKHYISKSSLPK
ncbi:MULTISPECIES: hypothetical protein [unclassified Microcoleus]|uniref:hypothetical protein n=1 Tax=unclassified Microcoleus TaxID=2642155 RepID=UPI002FD28B6E